MSTKAIKYSFDDETTDFTDYDPSKITIGSKIRIKTDGFGNNTIGPVDCAVSRVSDLVGFLTRYETIITIDDRIDHIYIFARTTSSSSTAGGRIYLVEFDKIEGVYNYIGTILLTLPSGNYQTPTGFTMLSEYYTTGTVSVSGNMVTGSGTSWQSSNLVVGSRIGFGSTNPLEIEKWYEISSINSDTSITLTGDIDDDVSSVSYAIHDLRAVFSISIATLGGLFVTKGLRPELFSSGSNTVPFATTIDNLRATYKLMDGELINTAPYGCAVDEKTSWVDQRVYCVRAGFQVFVFNIRASLSPTSGVDTSAFLFGTGSQSITGSTLTNNNGIIVTPNHGDAQGIKSLFFLTSTRVYQCDLSGITEDSTTWITRDMLEVPNGATNSFLVTSAFRQLTYYSDIDRFLITTPSLIYVARFLSGSNEFDFTFMADDRQMDGPSADSESFIHPSAIGEGLFVEVKNGYIHFIRNSITAGRSQIYSLPLLTNIDYAFDYNEYCITPKFTIDDMYKFYNITPRFVRRSGSDVFSIPNEGFSIFYRTSGIDDNTGAWTLTNQVGDLSGVTENTIQFAIVFNSLRSFGIPSKINDIYIVYEDDTSDGRYEPNLSISNLNDKIFSWRQVHFWDGEIPDLKISFIDISDNSVVLVDDTDDVQNGVWEYSTDDENWLPFDREADRIGNSIRYTTNSALLDGKSIKIKIQQLL
jgi:hypothetical protein